MNKSIPTKIALGKKSIDFFSYEPVIESDGESFRLVSVNLCAGNKLLTKIKVNIDLAYYDIYHLNQIVFEIISSFILQADNKVVINKTKINPKKANTSKKQNEARLNTAASLFDQFNL